MNTIQGNFKAFLKQMTPLSEQEFNKSIDYFTHRTLQKGEFLLKETTFAGKLPISISASYEPFI